MSFLPEPIIVLYVVIGILAVMTVLSLLHKKKFTEAEKKLFFGLIAIPVLVVTLYMAGHTIYTDVNSVTGGPVHWHADYQVWVCGERLDLMDPTFPSNKIGSPLFHEHNDDRIHVEGTVDQLENIDLGSYFQVIGGQLTQTALTYPTEDRGIIDVANGDLCDGVPSELKVYANGQLLESWSDYLYAPHAYVPPGDCLIIEFSPDRAATTPRLCESWEAKQWDYNNFEQLTQEQHPYMIEDREYYQGVLDGN